MNILDKIFSVKNEYKGFYKTKICTILGIKIKRKNINGDKILSEFKSHLKLISKQAKAIDDIKIKNKNLKTQINALSTKHNNLRNEYNDLKKRSETQYKLMNVISSPSKCPKAQGTLRQKQLKMAEVMSSLHKICEENGLSYWLDYGTLLGVHRHGGFIPWDCDADICMLREDYLKIIPLLKEYFRESDVKVREYYICKNGQVNYQLCLCNCEALNAWQLGGGKKEWGIDIFPVDSYYKADLTEEEIQNVNQSVKTASEELAKSFAQNSEKLKDIDWAREEIQKIEENFVLNGKKCSSENAALFYALDFNFTQVYPNLTFNYDTIFPLKRIEFEGHSYYCPNNFQKCLILHYGNNFEMFPPKLNPDEDKIDEYIREMKCHI